MKPHNLTLSFIGACLLWVGWFGFNAGSALAASSLATTAFVATHFASAAPALGWLTVEWLRHRICKLIRSLYLPRFSNLAIELPGKDNY